jgi:hypothetical protein
MRTLLGGLLCLFLVGCAMNRADFVAGPDGKPKEAEMSDTGKTIGNKFRNGLLSYRIGF